MDKHILVVDDEKEIADLVEVYLRGEGYEVLKYYNGQDALMGILSNKVDLAILDVMLPDIDGFTLCRKIKLGLEVHSVIFDKEHIKKELNSGRPIICILGPGDFTTTGHFIVLTGVDENGGIIVNDPNSIINSKKSWDIEQLMHQIRNLWSYS